MSLLPSLFTIANLFCGWACVVYAMRGDVTTAAPFIGVAIVLDMLDGRIARMTGTTSEFGVQLDSLADLISFGMAPAVLAFQWGLAPLGRLGWAVGFLFVTAAALRLARFNIQTPTDKRYFVGLPSPAAAAVPAATVFYFPTGMQTYQQALLAPARGAGAGAADGQHHPLPQLQDDRPRHQAQLPRADPLAALIAAVVSQPHEVLLVMAYAYLDIGVRRAGAAAGSGPHPRRREPPAVAASTPAPVPEPSPDQPEL